MLNWKRTSFTQYSVSKNSVCAWAYSTPWPFRLALFVRWVIFTLHGHPTPVTLIAQKVFIKPHAHWELKWTVFVVSGRLLSAECTHGNFIIEPLRSAFIAYDRLRSPTIAYDSLRSPTIAYDRLRSPTIAYDRLRSPTIAYDRLRSPTIAYDRLRSPTIAYDRLRSPTIAYDRLRSLMIAYDRIWSSMIDYIRLRSLMIAYDRLWSRWLSDYVFSHKQRM